MRPGRAIFISKYPWPRGLQKGRRNRGTGPTKRTAVKKGQIVKVLEEISSGLSLILDKLSAAGKALG